VQASAAEIGDHAQALKLMRRVIRRTAEPTPSMQLQLAALLLKAGQPTKLATLLNDASWQKKLSVDEKASLSALRISLILSRVQQASERGDMKRAFGHLRPLLQDYPDELYALVDIAIPNEHEIELITGMQTSTSVDATAAARKLAERGVGTVIVTRGAHGSVWVTLTRSGSAGAFTVRPVDTVAAGDAQVPDQALGLQLLEGPHHPGTFSHGHPLGFVQE